MLCRAVQGAAAEGGRWRKERAHLRLKWPPSSTYLIPSPTDLQQCSCSFHPWMNWVESTACWKVDGDFFSHPQKKITSHSLMLSGDLCVCRILRWVHHFFFFLCTRGCIIMENVNRMYAFLFIPTVGNPLPPLQIGLLALKRVTWIWNANALFRRRRDQRGVWKRRVFD